MPKMSQEQLKSYGEYLAAYRVASKALIREKQYIEDFAEGEIGSISDRHLALGAATKLAGKIQELDDCYNAMEDRFSSPIEAPDAATVKRAGKLAQDLALKLKTITAYTTVLNTVSAFITAWAKL